MAESQEHYLKQAKKCITFIFLRSDEYSNNYVPIGTGFFVSVSINGADAVYLVTAKHVLLSDSYNFYSSVYIRLNRKEENAQLIKLDLSRYKLWTHPDDNVDIVLFMVYFSQSEYDFLYLPDSYLFSREDASSKVDEGDEVFFAGLFANYVGNEKNYPILRFGRVSVLPDEKMEVNRYNEAKKLAHIYLCEIQSFSGNSGAPVFYQQPRILKDKKAINFGNPEIHLLGIIKGHYNDIRLSNTVVVENHVLKELNTGIAMITPSYLLQEILHLREVVQEREMVAKSQGIL